MCNAGDCTLDWDWQPTGTPANCPDSALPPKECSGSLTYCGDLVPFNPRTTIDYDDYPINGETSANQYRSWPRRDMALLVDYATSYTTCMSEGWPGNGGPLGLGDMSEEDGTIPGTSIGQPGHPANTHEDGYDMDIAYYQVNTADNKLRSVCDHVSGGSDQYHCTSEPYLLDVWRTATVLGAMLTSERVRVIGLDGKVGPLVEQAMQTLCNGGFLPMTSCNNMYKLAYEVTNEGLGWYYFHHHHFHISLKGIAGSSTNSLLYTTCLTPDCTPAVHDLGVLDGHQVPGHSHNVNPKAPLEKVRVLHLELD